MRRLQRRLASVTLLLSLCALAAAAIADNGTPIGGTPITAVQEGVAAPFTLPSLEGSPRELAHYRGRVTLVHFFATWCEPCREEMASLQQLQSALDGRPFAVLAISVAEADAAVRRFFQGHRARFPILLDRDRAVARAWNIQTLPSTVLLDGQLKPRFMAEGDVDWTRPDATKIIAELLSGTTE